MSRPARTAGPSSCHRFLAWLIAAASLALGSALLAQAPARRPSARPVPRDRPIATDDWTFRPTVLIRRGNGRGSGTVISSRPGQTLVLTAAHVLAGEGPVRVELHRYNLGLEHHDALRGGPWPKSVAATVVVTDREADVAVLRVEGLKPLPYVATLGDLTKPPAKGTIVTSIGIDQATDLNSWRTRVEGLATLSRAEGEERRLYLITARPPIHGRSGGGLFTQDHKLIGLCVGRIEGQDDTVGLFASGPSIRRVLNELGPDDPTRPAPAAHGADFQSGNGTADE